MGRPRVVFVVGATGTGKTRLGVQLAQAFNGEVVNADSLQMYKGLDIGTAKVTPEEADGVPHHLLSFLEPHEVFCVREFREKATGVIADLVSRGKLPVVVGGTLYYVQALLRESTLGEEEAAAGPPEAPVVPANPGEALYDYLSRVDPVMASRLHPNNTRKISRSIEMYQATGVPQSVLLERQAARLASAVGPYNACVLWLDAEREVLNARLDARVDTMMAAGLLDEVRGLVDTLGVPEAVEGGEGEGEGGAAAGAGGLALDAPKRGAVGLLQAIGYKEFSAYLRLVAGGAAASEATAALADCVTTLKTTTRRYARQQERFVRNRFIARGVPVHRLDTSDPGRWETEVRAPAVARVEALLRGEASGAVPATSDVDRIKAWRKYRCDACGRVLDGELEWQQHLRTRKHANAVRKRRREEGAPEEEEHPAKVPAVVE